MGTYGLVGGCGLGLRVRKARKPASRTWGFTLIELLVVISIIALLLSMLMPALNRAREIARRAVCGSNVRQMTVATYLYAEDHSYILPSHDERYDDPSHFSSGHSTRTF